MSNLILYTLVFGLVFIIILYPSRFRANCHPNTINYGSYTNFQPITVLSVFLPNLHPNTIHSVSQFPMDFALIVIVML